AKVEKRVTEKGLKLIVTEGAKDFLIDKGSSLEFGARPLRRAIEQYLEDMLAAGMLKGKLHGLDTITVEVVETDGDKRMTFETTKSADGTPTPVVAGEAK